MGVATIDGTLVCGMCGGGGTRTQTLHWGAVYTCPDCGQLGRWTGRCLRPLPWWWPPPGVLLRPWLAAVREVHDASPLDDDAPPPPATGYDELLRLLPTLHPDPPPGVPIAR